MEKRRPSRKRLSSNYPERLSLDARQSVPSVFRQAFGNWVAWCGIALASISAFNLCVGAFNLTLSEVFQVWLDGYRAVFHTIWDFLFFWVPLFWDIEIPQWGKDLGTLWMLGFATTFRTIQLFIKAEREHVREIQEFNSTASANAALYWIAEPRAMIVKAIAASLVWPFFLFLWNIVWPLTMWIIPKARSEMKGRFFISPGQQILIGQIGATIAFVLFMAATNTGLIIATQ